MKRKSQIALSTAALAAPLLVVGLGMFGGTAPPPAQAIVSEAPAAVASPLGDSAAPAWPAPGAAAAADRTGDDNQLSATGMEHIPVFD